jgi:hypothetical protein
MHPRLEPMEIAHADAARCAGIASAETAALPRGAGPLRRWGAILAEAVARVARHVKTRRRRARDWRLIASFDDHKLRDIGLDRHTDRLG